MQTIKKLICQPADQKTAVKAGSLADFFKNSSLKEKKEVFDEVIKRANRDQRKVLREYDKKFPNKK